MFTALLGRSNILKYYTLYSCKQLFKLVMLILTVVCVNGTVLKTLKYSCLLHQSTVDWKYFLNVSVVNIYSLLLSIIPQTIQYKNDLQSRSWMIMMIISHLEMIESTEEDMVGNMQILYPFLYGTGISVT
jgi:hypothetical protein